MQFTEILLALFGGLNIVQLIMAVRTFKSQIKKDQYLTEREKALTEKEKANSVEASQSIYDMMTERVKKELAEVYLRIQQQDQEIGMLREVVEGYKNKCAQCNHNKLAS